MYYKDKNRSHTNGSNIDKKIQKHIDNKVIDMFDYEKQKRKDKVNTPAYKSDNASKKPFTLKKHK